MKTSAQQAVRRAFSTRTWSSECAVGCDAHSCPLAKHPHACTHACMHTPTRQSPMDSPIRTWDKNGVAIVRKHMPLGIGQLHVFHQLEPRLRHRRQHLHPSSSAALGPPFDSHGHPGDEPWLAPHPPVPTATAWGPRQLRPRQPPPFLQTPTCPRRRPGDALAFSTCISNASSAAARAAVASSLWSPCRPCASMSSWAGTGA